MEHLGRLYLKEEVLHFESELFKASSPYISPSLSFPIISERVGESQSIHSFILGNINLIAKMKSCLRKGPLSGFKRIEVYKEDSILLEYEWGGRGFGSNYETGVPYWVEEGKALIFIDSYHLQELSTTFQLDKNLSGYYLLYFEEVSKF